MEEKQQDSYAVFDRTNFPIITVSFTGKSENQQNFQEYLDGLLQNYQRKQEFTLIFDASNASTPNPTYQKWQAQWMKDHDKLVKTYCRGVAYVVPSPFLRGILKVIFGLQKNPVPFKVFKDIKPANDWAKEQL